MSSDIIVPGQQYRSPVGKQVPNSGTQLPYDSDLKAAINLTEQLQDRASHLGTMQELGHFDREIREKFHEIGWEIDIKWHHTNVAGVKLPEIELLGRVEKREFDHDQMRHEVINDVLETGDKGMIKVGAEDVRRIKETEAAHKKAHGHGEYDEHDGHAH